MAKKSLIVILTFLTLLFIFVPFVAAQDQQITVAWDANAEADLHLYTIYYGAESGNYTHSINTRTDSSGRDAACTTYDPFDNNCCQYTLKGLNIGTYYLAATASDVDGNESAFSEELIHTFVDNTTIEKLPEKITQPDKIHNIPTIN